jgi:hypothetical protein
MSEQIALAKKEKGGKKQDVDYTITREEVTQMHTKEREELDKKMAKALASERKTEGAIPAKEQSIPDCN